MDNRKKVLRYVIEQELILILENAKAGNKYVAKYEFYKFKGIIMYAERMRDINEEIYWKLYNLSDLIRRKYDLY